MKAISFLALAGITLSTVLMAEPREVEAPEPPQVIALRAPMSLKANDDAIDSILTNAKLKTTIDKLNAPIFMRSMEDVRKYLTPESAEMVLNDFKQYELVAFIWQGSSDDRLLGSMLRSEAYGAMAGFNYIKGKGDVEQTHTAVYGLFKDTRLHVRESDSGVEVMMPEPKAAALGPGTGIAKNTIPVHLGEPEDLEANGDAIESILLNSKLKTTIKKLNAPIVIRSMEDAQMYLTRASVEKIDVDFNTDELAIFIWQGSDADSLRGRMAYRQNVPEAYFTYGKGVTKEQRTHAVIYKLYKGAKVTVTGARR